MLKKWLPQNTLLCFSPPVMIASFFIEIILGIYIIFRYKPNLVLKLSATLLTALATFQLAEYFVCGGLGANAMTWSRIGYVMITALPPLGLHLLYAINRRQIDVIVAAAYASGAAFAGYFLLASGALSGHRCTGNYVIFQTDPKLTHWYAAYYGGWLVVAMLAGLIWLRREKSMPAKIRQSTKALMAGYLVFLIPSAVIYDIRPETVSGLPSIMCGFAVTLALIVALYIIPRMTEEKSLQLHAIGKTFGR